MEIGDVTILDGTAEITDAVIIDADTAARSMAAGELTELVESALRALHLSGKNLVYVREQQ